MQMKGLYSLPTKFGGIGVIIPSMISDQEYLNSRIITRKSKGNDEIKK